MYGQMVVWLCLHVRTSHPSHHTQWPDLVIGIILRVISTDIPHDRRVSERGTVGMRELGTNYSVLLDLLSLLHGDTPCSSASITLQKSTPGRSQLAVLTTINNQKTILANKHVNMLSYFLHQPLPLWGGEMVMIRKMSIHCSDCHF